NRDPRSTEELIRASIENWDKEDSEQENRPRAIAILHARGDRATLEAARTLCTSANSKERAVGAAILSQLGYPDRTFPAECISILLEMLQSETDPIALSSICSAFNNHERDTNVIRALSSFKTHPDERVRFGVTLGLLWSPDT